MITIHLANPINNASLQIGDFAYYIDDLSTSGLVNSQSTPIYIGVITNIGPSWIEVDNEISPTTWVTGTYNPSSMFLMFSKDTRTNNTSLLGYYAEVTMVNNSSEEAELFMLGSETAPSSK
jgi:hypothetical protein